MLSENFILYYSLAPTVGTNKDDLETKLDKILLDESIRTRQSKIGNEFVILFIQEARYLLHLNIWTINLSCN